MNDEGIAIAKSGYRPTVTGVADIDYVSQEGTRITTGSFGVQVNQTIFDGFQTLNNVRSAEAQVFASRENLRNTEQNILFNAASAYMDVIRDRKIAQLTQQNLAFLTEQVRAARSRFDVGEGTRTDVAQAEASQATARADVSTARSNVLSSEATYRQVVGDEPTKLELAGPQSKHLPKGLDGAIAGALEQHPAIVAAEYAVDAAAFEVKSAEGALLPQISASAGVNRQVQRSIGIQTTAGILGLPGVRQTFDETEYQSTATVGASLNIPIYEGGRVSAIVRQNKETLGQRRIAVDVSRNDVREAVEAAWAQYSASVENVGARRQVVAAAQLALNGVIEERNVGQRTTLDVLDAQATVISGQIDLVQAERDVVVGSYAILSSVGRLSAQELALNVEIYQPEEHFNAVKDKWWGLRTPDGR